MNEDITLFIESYNLVVQSYFETTVWVYIYDPVSQVVTINYLKKNSEIVYNFINVLL